MSAIHSCDELFATYAESETPSLGCQRAFEEFPPEEGYRDHQIKNVETGAKYLCKRKESEQ